MSLPPPADPAADAARLHLDLHVAVVTAGVLRLLGDAVERGVLAPDELEERFPFLPSVGDELAALAAGAGGEHDPAHFRRLAADVAVAAPEPPPLARLAAFVDRSGAADVDADLAVDVVAAAALVERDGRFGAVFGSLQAPRDERRPCIALLSMLLGRGLDEITRIVDLLSSIGCLSVEQPDEPRADQTVRVPPAILLVLEGRPPPELELSPAAAAPDLDDLVLPPALVDRLARAAALLQEGDLAALVLRGAAGTGRRTALRAIAGRLGRGLLVATPGAASGGSPGATGAWPGAIGGSPGTVGGSPGAIGGSPGAVAVLTGALLAWSVEPGLGQLVDVPSPPGAGPIGVIAGQRGAVRVDGGERVAVVDLPTPGVGARARFWTGAGLPAEPAVLDTVSRRFVLSGGTIGRVASLAAAIARLDGRGQVTVDDVRQAAQDQGRQRLESLAALLPSLPPALAPVLSGGAADAYEALVLRSRHREELGVAVGGPAGEQVNRGVRALLSGPSGTGKTLTARALGARLDLDVYRADLAALVDKYIGETERRLDELFSRAEELDVVLLIDEGDALMTRRTDVRSSNDRYANLETDYLLQRLEAYEGIVLITTNAPHLVDDAFHRRLDVTMAFGPPGSADRLQIWRQHLPTRHAVTPAGLDRLATTCRLTGGQIRNAAVHAALLALDADRLVDDLTLTAAVERELAAAGRSSPLAGRKVAASPFERAVAMP